MSEKIFVLGSMPVDAKPNSHIASGEWCFTRREDVFPSWDTDFQIARCYLPETDSEAIEEAQRAIGWGVQLLHEYARHKNVARKDHLPPEVWEFLLGRVFISLGLGIVYAYNTVQLWLRDYGDVPLTIPMSGMNHFTDCSNLEREIFEPDGMHWLFSEILRHMAPTNWNLISGKESFVHVPSEAPLPPMQESGTWKETIIQLQKWVAVKLGKLDWEKAYSLKLILKQICQRSPRLRSIWKFLWCSLRFGSVWHFFLPSPRVKSITFSASFLQKVCIKAALLINREERNDRELLVEKFGDKKGEYPAFCRQIALKMLPAYLDNIEKEVYKKKSIRKTYFLVNEDLFDKRYASLLWGGARFIVLQHAPFYAVMPMALGFGANEFTQHRFGVWGSGTGFTRPVKLPSFYYNRIAGSHAERRRVLYCISGIYKFPLQLLLSGFCMRATVRELRDDLKRFINSLPLRLRGDLLLRPYVDSDQESWEQRFFPDIPCNLDPDFSPHFRMMRQCRVAAVNYLGSTFGQALILNTPLVLFFRLNSYTLTPAGENLLKHFQEVGIFHETAEQAASFVDDIWEAVPKWWNSAEVQAARKEYLLLDADVAGDNILKTWIKNVLSI